MIELLIESGLIDDDVDTKKDSLIMVFEFICYLEDLCVHTHKHTSYIKFICIVQQHHMTKLQVKRKSFQAHPEG